MQKRMEAARTAIPLTELQAYDLDPQAPLKVFQGKGCDNCGQTGYKGRIAIYEVFEVTDEAKIIITDKTANENELKKEAVHQHMLMMKIDGLLKVLKGITTIAEVERVTEGTLVDEE
jgi:type IV pilus assembly protein PilB